MSERAISERLQQAIRKAVLSYSIGNRRRKAEHVVAWLRCHEVQSVLFVGTMGDEHSGNPDMANAGIVEKRIAETYPVKMGINIEPAETTYPFQIADARDMPFDDDYVDFALAADKVYPIARHRGGRIE